MAIRNVASVAPCVERSDQLWPSAQTRTCLKGGRYNINCEQDIGTCVSGHRAGTHMEYQVWELSLFNSLVLIRIY